MNKHVDRRKQPQTTITAIRQALDEIDWSVKEVTSQTFVSASGKHKNESFGYELAVPPEMFHIKSLWVGYLSHKDVKPAGIYAAMNPTTAPEGFTPLKKGYQESPFRDYFLIKPILSIEEIKQLQYDYGEGKLKEKIKQILVKTYPFSLK